MIKNALDKNRLEFAIINLPLNLTNSIYKNKKKTAPWTQW